MPRRSLDPRISVAVVYVAAQFMSIMDTTIVNVALPKLAREFNVAGTSIEWVVTGYLLSLAVFIPASGWLGDRWGTRRVFLFALGLFVLASALCGLAQSFEQLVVFRALQGAGGGMLTPVGMAMLFRTFPPEQRVRASAILIIPTVVAPAMGPVLGGVLVDQLSWRWVFYVNVPIGVAALIFGLLFLHEHREAAPGRFDLPGFLLAGSGFPLVLYALSEGPRHGWGSLEVLGAGIAGLLLLTAFVIVELRTPEPMVQLRLLGNRLFRSASTVAVMASGGFLGVLFLVPLFVQQARGQSALASGLTTFPEAVGVLVSSQVIARLYPRVGPRRLAAGGMLFVAAMMLLLTRVGLDTEIWVLQALMFLIGAGMACNFLPMQTAAFATITPSATGRGSTLFNAQRQLGAALGVAVISSVLAAAGPTEPGVTGGAQPNVAAYHAAFLAAAAFALGAALLALTIRDRDAAPTMQRKRREEAPAVGEVAIADD
jgi:EmrB/QacA subfamily drug resistance transporter